MRNRANESESMKHRASQWKRVKGWVNGQKCDGSEKDEKCVKFVDRMSENCLKICRMSEIENMKIMKCVVRRQ